VDETVLNCDSWTAVVRGAAICGIEKHNNKLPTMIPWNKFYGVSVDAKYSYINHDPRDATFSHTTNTWLAKQQLIWLIKKGDLISSEPYVEHDFEFMFDANHSRRGAIRIFSYEYDDAPERLSIATEEVQVAKELRWSLVNYNLADFIHVPSTDRSTPAQFCANFCLRLELRGDDLEARLTWRNEVLSREMIRYR